MLAITPKGLSFLRAYGLSEWCKFLEDHERFSLFADRHKDRIARFVRRGNALMFAKAARCAISDYVVSGFVTNTLAMRNNIFPALPKMETTEEKRKTNSTPLTLGEIRKKAAEQRLALPDICKEKQPLYYFPAEEIWKIYSSLPNLKGYYAMGFAGIIASQHSCIMLYHAAYDGIRTKSKRDKDFLIARNFCSSCSPFLIRGTEQYHAIKSGWLFYNNKTNFINIIRNQYKTMSANALADGQCLHFLCPLSEEGARFIRLLSLQSMGDIIRTINEYAISKLHLHRFNGNNPEMRQIFAFETEDGIPVFNGFYFDIFQIRRLDQFIRDPANTAYGNREFRVLCMPFQAQYYYDLWRMDYRPSLRGKCHGNNKTKKPDSTYQPVLWNMGRDYFPLVLEGSEKQYGKRVIKRSI